MQSAWHDKTKAVIYTLVGWEDIHSIVVAVEVVTIFSTITVTVRVVVDMSALR